MVGPHVVTNGPEQRLRDFKYDPSPLPVTVLAPDHQFEWAIEVPGPKPDSPFSRFRPRGACALVVLTCIPGSVSHVRPHP